MTWLCAPSGPFSPLEPLIIHGAPQPQAIHNTAARRDACQAHALTDAHWNHVRPMMLMPNKVQRHKLNESQQRDLLQAVWYLHKLKADPNIYETWNLLPTPFGDSSSAEEPPGPNKLRRWASRYWYTTQQHPDLWQRIFSVLENFNASQKLKQPMDKSSAKPPRPPSSQPNGTTNNSPLRIRGTSSAANPTLASASWARVGPPEQSAAAATIPVEPSSSSSVIGGRQCRPIQDWRNQLNVELAINETTWKSIPLRQMLPIDGSRVNELERIETAIKSAIYLKRLASNAELNWATLPIPPALQKDLEDIFKKAELNCANLLQKCLLHLGLDPRTALPKTDSSAVKQTTRQGSRLRGIREAPSQPPARPVKRQTESDVASNGRIRQLLERPLQPTLPTMESHLTDKGERSKPASKSLWQRLCGFFR